jgi:hypothetical protein
MRIRYAVASVRKLGHFVVTLFPELSRGGVWLRERFRRTKHLAPAWEKLRSGRRAQATIGMLRDAFWPDYGRDRVDWARLSPEAVSILRPVFLLALLLCVSLPFAASRLSGTGITWPGTTKPVATWDMWVWLTTLAMAWGFLLVGAARANRLAYPVALAVFVFFNAYAAISSLPRSWWNLPIPVAVLAVARFAERRLRGPGSLWRTGVLAAFSCVVSGILVSFSLFGLTPLSRLLAFPGRVAGGLLVGGALLWFSLQPERAVREDAVQREDRGMARWAAGLGGVLFLLWLTFVCRGGWKTAGQGVTTFFDLWTGYLWPIWYALGAGFIWGVVKSARSLISGLEELLPGWVIACLAVVLVVAGALITWSEWVLDTPGIGWPLPVLKGAASLYRLSESWVWGQGLVSLTAVWLRWVFLVDLLLLLYLAVSRSLSAKAAASVLFFTVLLSIFVYEYNRRSFVLTRSQTYSVVVLLLFALCILWLLYSFGVPRSMRGTRWWPANARTAMFGGVFLFVLLDIHARGAVADRRAVQLILWYLFRGIVDLGLPYFLFVYAASRMKEPLPVPRLIASFAAGGVMALLLNCLDKVVAAGGSLGAMAATLGHRMELVLAGASGDFGGIPAEFSVAWLVVRAALVFAFLAGWSLTLHRKSPRPERSPSAAPLGLIAGGAGLAAFSQIRLDLPLVPPKWALLYAPARSSLDIDYNLVWLWLAYVVAAMILCLGVVLRRRSRWLALSALPVAGLWIGSIVLLWARSEFWLRSTGLVGTLTVMGGLIFVLLVEELRRMLTTIESPVQQPEEETGDAKHVATRRRRWAAASLTLVLLALGATAGGQALRGRLVPHTLPGAAGPLWLPSPWAQEPVAPPNMWALFSRRSIHCSKSSKLLLYIQKREGVTKEAMELTEEVLNGAATFLPGFSRVTVPRSLDQSYPGGTITGFCFQQSRPGGQPEMVAGSVAVLPGPRGQALLLTLLSPLSDYEQRRWDLFLIARGLRTSPILP